MKPMEHSDLRAARASKMHELAQRSRSVNVGMEGWAMGQASLTSNVEKHAGDLVMLKSQVAEMDKVVKHHASIVNHQDLHKLKDERNSAMEGLEAKLMRHVHELIAESGVRFQKTINTLQSAVDTNTKRIKESEDHLIEHITDKLAEAAAHRSHNTDMVEKLRLRCDQFEEDLTREAARMRDLVAGKQTEAKRSTVLIAQELESEKLARDKAVLQCGQEMQKKLETMRNELETSLRAMRGGLEKHYEEYQKTMADHSAAINGHTEERQDATAGLMQEVHDQVNKLRRDLDKAYTTRSSEADRKLSVLTNTVADLRSQLEHEKKTREHGLNDVCTAIQQERKDRDVDEDRLLGMISAIHSAIDKVHRTSAVNAPLGGH